ncbi:putative protein phosphatase 2C 27 [Platanthera zijinensis]|uniref:Uncharacterized protein n=1 Tax=Platanthera zijinensis TaxID=2320716 RepID=A0AAP0C553_9ASPA
MLEGRHGDKESDSSLYTEGLDSPWRMEQLKDEKPHQHLSIIRHCASTARLVDSSEQILVSTHGLSFSEDSDLGFPSLSSSLDDQSGFLPVFQYGSYTEIGPKLYMEDEHIFIDDIVDHLGANSDLPVHGAFYGARFIFKSIFWGMSILCAHGGNV